MSEYFKANNPFLQEHSSKSSPQLLRAVMALTSAVTPSTLSPKPYTLNTLNPKP